MKRMIKVIDRYFKTLLLLPLIAGLLLSHIANAGENLRFRNILKDSTEQLGYINTIVQDTDGFMWFGGNNGLARFDGYSLKFYRSNSVTAAGLISNQINKLMITRNGTMWVATALALHRYNPDSDTFSVFKNSGTDHNSEASNYIHSVFEDSKGRLWLGTSGGLYQFLIAEQKYLDFPLSAPNNSQGENLTIWNIVQDRDDVIWIGLHNHGIASITPTLDQVTFYQYDPLDETSLYNNDIRSLMIDADNNVWAGSHEGNVSTLNSARSAFYRHDQIGDIKDAVWSIKQDRQGQIWIGNGRGLHLIDDQNKTLANYRHTQGEEFGLGNYAVREIFENDVGDIWLGYFPSGASIIDRQASSFHNIKPDNNDPHSIIGGGIAAVIEDSPGHYWIGSGWGLTYYDEQTGTAERFFHEANNPNSIAGNSVLSLLKDAQGDLWIGTWTKGLSRYHRESKTYTHYMPINNDKTSLCGYEIWDIFEDSGGDIWFATELGVCRYNRKTGDFTQFKPEAKDLAGNNQLYSRMVYEDRNKQIWIASSTGLYLLNPTTGAFKAYHHQQDTLSLPVNFIRIIYEDSQHRMWIGTHGGGLCLFDKATGQCTNYKLDNGIADLVVTGIIEDHSGLLWITTQRGLSRFNPKKEQFKNYYKRHGLLENVFNRNTPIMNSAGEIVVGSTGGITIFDPSHFSENTHIPPIEITDLFIFNKSVTPEEGGILKKSIIRTDEIVLSYRDSVFSLQFAALNYKLPEDNQYAYRMLGFDSNWIDNGHNRQATFTNLDPGTYTFEVKGTNNDAVWNNKGKSLKIIIVPPWWKTWWAKIIAACIAASLIYWTIYIRERKLELQSEKAVNAKLVKIDKIKDTFLANTSHELRTPLNGIIGLTECLIDSSAEKLNGEELNQLNLIVSSGKRLASLINDILDYSKMSNKKLDVKLVAINLHRLINTVFALLKPMVESKGVALVNDVPNTAPLILADENRLQQILINLVGNAIKYTDKGHIKLSCLIEDSNYTVIIEDTGIGMNPDDAKHIFNAFEQLEDKDGRQLSGTGLGLAITKQLVEIQGGSIHVSSEPGRGSTFSFKLQVAQSELDELNVNNSYLESTATVNMLNSAVNQCNKRDHEDTLSAKNTVPKDSSNFKILIVDDDPVNRMVLSGILKIDRYQTLEAADGQEALEKIAVDSDIDLVILDVMMPRMSGFETCTEIRKSHAIHELPIIFLTAKNTDDDIKLGFKSGGNEFMLKPVSKDELLPRVENHLKILTVIREYKRLSTPLE